MRLKQDLKLFALGAAAYPLIEMAWRGRTAPSMSVAGGTGMYMLSRLSQKMEGRPLWQKCLAGGAALTALEYVMGRTVNSRHQIWDYSRMPFHVNGQICPQYAALWSILSLPAYMLASRVRR
jgi:uncharacterized membrane protein